MDEIITLDKCTGFEWDEGNHEKNWIKHDVSQLECEQIFFNEPLLLFDDKKHSSSENRWFALGNTDDGRNLFIAFTIRNHLIRVISARTMSRKERDLYEKI
ncbi:hypothetical protein AYO45_06130 [Gammaproteobacteria bacterium SCGC AG-212-F23]|nr:hypothetical protein AYO45_06110 [Gammaproteobacteria bacterium SCGC AG-212-F23]OAI46864.1 hypothetical protein AYO45_06130 [Gammaproteobacteria bacterium SCGC AG-212-F23]